MATAWRFASASSPRASRGVAVVLAAVLALAVQSTAARADIQKVGGTLAVGGAKLFLENGQETPSGSISFAGGFDYPITAQWRVGPELGFHLLGTRNVEAGSFTASVDYSTFEASLLAHWLPTQLGPLRRVSFGPTVMSVRAEVSAGAGGASFSELAIEEVAPGVAASITLIPSRDALVRAGLEIGARAGWLPNGDRWTVGLLRLGVHF
jgi:hypothetical protein